MNSNPEYQGQPISQSELFTQVPRVTLLARTQTVLDPDSFSKEDWQNLNAATTVAGESARTCYAPGLITPLDYITASAKHRLITDSVVKSTREAGHLSTRQHVYYLFALEGVSRNIVYSVLHSYPFHNSDQVSQRYTPMKESGLVLPILEDRRLNSVFREAASSLVTGYQHLTDLLIPLAQEFISKRFPSRRNLSWQKKINAEAIKKAQEIGRYLLPLAMGANLYHSISALTLMRYHRLSRFYRAQPEAHLLIQSMIDQVASVDPTILNELDEPLDPDLSLNYPLPYFNPAEPYEASDIADSYLAGLTSRLDLTDINLSERLASAVRLTIGRNLTNHEAIDLVLNPAKNKLLASTHGEMTMDQLSQALNQVSFSATVSLSHSADSQLQRHRGFNHTQPLGLAIPRLKEDIVIPQLLNYSQEALNYYLDLQQQNIQTMNLLREAGVSLEALTYLQTNATRIRKRINGPLGAFHHWIKIRTCLTAQEEIYGLAVSLAQQLRHLAPGIAQYFDKPAPCGVRHQAGLTPLCPEGDRYCGVPIWKESIADYPKRDI